jgi:membrane-associated protease RseP (regulator of RpoE activity)
VSAFDLIINFLTDPFFIYSAIFWIICYIAIKILGKKRENVTLMFPFLAMFRTKRFNKWLHKIAMKFPRFWKFVWNVGIFVSFGFIIYAIYFFITNLIDLITAPSIENVISPLIPGVNIDFPMFSYLILPLLLIITIHEFSHAMAAEIDGIEVKSTGVMGAGVFFVIAFGAFVEIDEFAVNSKKVSIWTRLRIACAGTFSNAIQAGIGILLIMNFAAVISPFYGPEAFQVDYTLTSAEGGYNDGNIFTGDKVLGINDTIINIRKGISLTAILNNKTEGIECSVGDTLNFSVIDSRGIRQNRLVILGHHFFLGFRYQFSEENESVIEITEVYEKIVGGNNFDVLSVGMRFISIDGFDFNITKGKTPESYLNSQIEEKIVNITTITDQNISIHLDYFPLVAGAYEFRSFFTGIFFEKLSSEEVKVTRVLKNTTESGLNQNLVFEDDIITKVNGIELNLTGDVSFEQFILNDVGLIINNNTEVIFTVKLNGNEQEINRTVIFKPMQKSSVYIGIGTSPYWVPKNWLSSMMGGIFPIWLEREFMFFFIIALSVTMFNMLPLPIFDGNRVIKEIINSIIGSKYERGKTKRIMLNFSQSEADYHLKTYNITRIQNVEVKLDSQFDYELNYKAKDTIGDDFVDTISFDIENPKLPPTGTAIEVIVEHDQDQKAPLKRKIMNLIGIGILIIVVMNFIMSYVLFGDVVIPFF